MKEPGTKKVLHQVIFGEDKSTSIGQYTEYTTSDLPELLKRITNKPTRLKIK